MIELIGFGVILIFGTLSHFFYEWSHHKKIFALFFAVNESTWEHIKLGLSGTFLWIIIELFFFKIDAAFLFSKLVSLLAIIILIPLFYYGYRLIFKRSIFILNILEFILTIALSQLFAYLIYSYTSLPTYFSYILLPLIVIIFIAYLWFTYRPAKTFLFKDPINNKYGIDAHMKYKK